MAGNRITKEYSEMGKAYVAAPLLDNGYEVHGIKRHRSLFNTARIDQLINGIHEKSKPLFQRNGNMTESLSLAHIIQKVQPDEIHNLAPRSHVAVPYGL